MSGKGHFYDKGLYFSCKRCSACCRFESGFVFLSENDVSALKAALKLEYEEFLDLHCRWIPSLNGIDQLSLKEKTNYDCVFWSFERGGACLVYDARPLQCRAFPFWVSVLGDEESWKMAAEGCSGMDQGSYHSPGSIKKWLSTRQKEPIISRTGRFKGES